MLFGNVIVWLLDYTADGELRICIPMSDVIDSQFDDVGVKLLLDIGGEGFQRTLQLTVELNR